MDESRFDRLEQKIDKLTDAVTKIVRVEEQIASNNRRMDAVEERLNRHSKDLDNVGNIVRKNESIARVADKMFWLFMAGLVSYVFYVLK